MMLIDTYLAKSNINGIGLFAAQNIKKDSIVWKFARGLDVEITENELYEYPIQYIKYISKHGYKTNNGKYIVCLDDAQYYNHSDNPNTGCDDHNQCFALRDIVSGEELTCNYRDFDLNADLKLVQYSKPIYGFK